MLCHIGEQVILLKIEAFNVFWPHHKKKKPKQILTSRRSMKKKLEEDREKTLGSLASNVRARKDVDARVLESGTC